MFSYEETKNHRSEPHSGTDHHHGHHGRHHGHSGEREGVHSGHVGREPMLSPLEGKPDAMLLFVGEAGCARRWTGSLRGAEDRLFHLSPEGDKDRLQQIGDTLVRLSQEQNITEFVVLCGCQFTVPPDTFDITAQALKETHSITAVLAPTCRMCGRGRKMTGEPA